MNAPVTKPRVPLMSRVPADFVRAVLKGHSALGLAFAAIIYLVCITGSLAVFAAEFERWEHANAPRVTNASPEVVQRALETVLRGIRHEVEHAYIQLPRPDVPHLSVRVETPDGYKVWLADTDGSVKPAGGTPWTEFLTRLHINLHLPQVWGIFIVGLTGVALLSSLISGILAHPRIFRDAFQLRIGGSRRLQEADLHNRIGVWALPFHVIVSLTGALLGLTTLIVGVLGFALFQGDVDKVYTLFLPAEPTEDARPAPLLDLVPMWTEVTRLSPEGRIDLIMLEHPKEMGGAAMFLVDSDERRLASGDTFAFQRGGKLYYSRQAADNNLGENILASLGPLHFGWFGGGVVKVAYGLLGLGLSYLAAGGVLIWLARRRDKRRPAPRLERVWASVIWGQPVALATAALVAVIGGTQIPVSLLITSWAAVTILSLVVAIWLPPQRLSATLLSLLAALLAATGVIHIGLRSGPDPASWTVDAVLVAAGLFAGYLAVQRHRSVAA